MQTRFPPQVPCSFSAAHGVQSASATDLSVQGQTPVSAMKLVTGSPSTVSVAAQVKPQGQGCLAGSQGPPQNAPSAPYAMQASSAPAGETQSPPVAQGLQRFACAETQT